MPLGLVLLGLAALPPYRAAAWAQQFLAVRQLAALSLYQVVRMVVTGARYQAGPRYFRPVPAHLLALSATVA
jgi:hypothetical protein